MTNIYQYIDVFHFCFVHLITLYSALHNRVTSWRTASSEKYNDIRTLYHVLSASMGCPPVRGDNPRALASGLSYVQVDKHCITILYHLYQCKPCTSRDISFLVGKGDIKLYTTHISVYLTLLLTRLTKTTDPKRL